MSVLAVIGKVLLVILQVIGWVLLGILALILFVLCVRIRFDIEYSAENTSVVLRWLFLKFRLYPMKKKEKKPKKKKEEPKPEETPEETQEETPEEAPAEQDEEKPKQKKDNMLTAFYKAEGLDGVLTLLKKACSYLKTFFGNLLRGVVVDEFYLDMRCVKADAAETAIFYGEVCAAVFPMLTSLASRCRLKKYDVNVYPDYLARYSDASFVLKLHFTPIYFVGIILALGIKLLFGVLLKLLLPKKQKKTAQKPDIEIKSKEKSEAK